MEAVLLNHPTPQGFSAVRPYLMVADVEKQLRFLQDVFDAVSLQEIKDEAGKILHAEIQIGDTIVMIGQSSESFISLPGMNYVYLSDIDKTFEKAKAAGVETIAEPAVQFYGNKEGGFKDLHGNVWWISQFINEVSSDEIERIAMSQKK